VAIFFSFHSRRSSKLVFKLGPNALDFSFGAAASISVPPFEEVHEVVALASDSIEIIGTEFSPLGIDFIPKVLPLHFENVGLHLCFT
jgi:hypothetical protein